MTAAPAARPALPQVPRAAPPPFRLPAEHFAASLLWLGLAAAMMPRVAPLLARGNIFEPAVFALLHAVMLGVVTSAIFGALCQFVPGGLEVPLRSVAIGHLGFWLLQAGVAALVAGFWWWEGTLQAFGWLGLFGAVGAASVNFLPARRKSTHGRLVGLYLSVAHSALGLAMALAAARIGTTLGWWTLERNQLLVAHFHLGAVGFATVTAFGVGSRMLPTFLLSRGADDARLLWLLRLAIGGLLGITVGAVLRRPVVSLIGAGLLLGSGGVMLSLGWSWFRRRNRPLDASLWHVAGGFAGLAAAMGWGIAATFAPPGAAPRFWAAYAAALVLGWLVLLVTGVQAKILSHLSYIHLFARMPGFARAGNPNRLLRADLGHLAAVLLALGGLGLPVAVAAGHSALATAIAWIWTAGVAATLGNYLQAIVLGKRAPPS